MPPLSAITGQLAGQIPLITMAGVTVKYKKAMLGNGKGKRRGRRLKGMSRWNSPF